MPEGRTHAALSNSVKVESFSSLFIRQESFRRAILFICQFVLVRFPPGLRYPASFIEEFPNGDNVVAGTFRVIRTQTTLISLEKSFHVSTLSLWTALMGNDQGHNHHIFHVSSRVSCVATRYLSSFSLKASFILSVGVTFISTTAFHHWSSESRCSHTRSGFIFAPGKRTFSFHPSDNQCSVPMVISSRDIPTIFQSSHFCSRVINPLRVRMLLSRIFTTVSCRTLISHVTFI